MDGGSWAGDLATEPGIEMSAVRVEHCMGTVFSIDIRTPELPAQLLEDVISWLHWVDATFSTYQPESEISRLGRGELRISECAAEVAEVLDRCTELTAFTGGYFSAYADGRLDPSGLVKGWAIERASDLLVAGGSRSHCVNGGGDVQCAGDAAPGEPWRIGIAHPLDATLLAGVVTGTDLAVATSGSAERGGHIVDPHTGAAPPAALASVSVIGSRVALADAYATAAFAMGEQAQQWLDTIPDYWGFGVRPDGSSWASTGIRPH